MYIHCTFFVSAMFGLPYLSFVFLKLVCYVHVFTYTVYTCIFGGDGKWEGWNVGGMEFHVHVHLHVYCTYRMFSIDICCTLNSSKLTMGVHLLICQSTPPLPTFYTIPTQTHV